MTVQSDCNACKAFSSVLAHIIIHNMDKKTPAETFFCVLQNKESHMSLKNMEVSKLLNDLFVFLYELSLPPLHKL